MPGQAQRRTEASQHGATGLQIRLHSIPPPLGRSVPEHHGGLHRLQLPCSAYGFPQAFFGVGTKENGSFVIHLEIILSGRTLFFMPAVFY